MVDDSKESVWPTDMLEHRRFLRGLAMLQLCNEAEAEDAVQEALMSAAAGIRQFSGNVPIRLRLRACVVRGWGELM